MNSTPFPKISIVTPSFNQGAFLEATIRSILDQSYPNLEYIVMDGGSSDNSVEIIKRYEDRITFWTSQKDKGQYNAVNNGFKHASGDIFAYLNSDDLYWPWTFRTVAHLFMLFPQIQWLTSRTLMILGPTGLPAQVFPAEFYSRTRFYRGMDSGKRKGRTRWIQQEATFWRCELWEQAGARMDETIQLAGDFELWARFFQYANLVTTDIPLAGYRFHGANKAHVTRQAYLQDCDQVLKRYAPQSLKTGFKRALTGQIVRWTGRGARLWGSTANWVRYDQAQAKWTYNSSYVM
ncbi:MAG: glycosyltransferase [Anaerolineae bacterium]|nr:glycosyltransferase [Anaerolineae bacterium]